MNFLIQAGGACLMLALPTSGIDAAETTGVQSSVNAASAKSSPVSKAVTAELSVPPLDHVEYPMSRPAWCDQKPNFTQRDHTIVVVAGPCDSPMQCEDELQWMQRAAVVTYANGLVESDSGIDFSAYSDQDIDDHLVSRRYEGSVTKGGETKYEKVVQLEMTPEIQSEIRQASRGIEVGRRLGFLAVVGLLGTVLLACSSGLLGLASRRVSKRETILQ